MGAEHPNTLHLGPVLKEANLEWFFGPIALVGRLILSEVAFDGVQFGNREISTHNISFFHISTKIEQFKRC